MQVRKFTKDFPNSKTVDLEMLDGDTLYVGKGWSFWGTETALGIAVSNSSTSGWADGSGEVTNINEDVYGTAFKFW